MKGNRAGINFESIIWIPRIIFIIVIMFLVMTLVRSYVSTVIETSDIKADLFSNRLIYSPNSISYYDGSIKRAYPGIIYLAKFNSDDFLDKSIYYGEKNREIGAKVVLKDFSDGKEYTLFYNKNFFSEQKRLADAGLTEGPGGAKSYTKKYNILVMKDNLLNNGTLTIDIAIPNS